MQVNEMVVDDTTKMNVRWKSGSQVKRAREVTYAGPLKKIKHTYIYNVNVYKMTSLCADYSAFSTITLLFILAKRLVYISG